MFRILTIFLATLVATPSWGVDAWTCLEDGESIELSGALVREHYADAYHWVLLTEDGYCRQEYQLEQADFVVTNTNVMRFELLDDGKPYLPDPGSANKVVVVKGTVQKAFEETHKTPLVILLEALEPE